MCTPPRNGTEVEALDDDDACFEQRSCALRAPGAEALDREVVDANEDEAALNEPIQPHRRVRPTKSVWNSSSSQKRLFGVFRRRRVASGGNRGGFEVGGS